MVDVNNLSVQMETSEYHHEEDVDMDVIVTAVINRHNHDMA